MAKRKQHQPLRPDVPPSADQRRLPRHDADPWLAGPSPADLDAIEAETPLAWEVRRDWIADFQWGTTAPGIAAEGWELVAVLDGGSRRMDGPGGVEAYPGKWYWWKRRARG